MKIQKAGVVLLNPANHKIGLIYREKQNDYSFPKGHLEEGETLPECAVRETEEETMRANHLLSDKEIDILTYTTPSGEVCENYMYIAIDDGPTTKEIADIDKEDSRWFEVDEVYDLLTYDNLKEFWNRVKDTVKELLKKEDQRKVYLEYSPRAA